MKKKIIFFSLVAIVLLLVPLLPTTAGSNTPGAGDIWWMNVPEINESYHKIKNRD
ncbi:hypothetical protein ACERII_10800 [Evansella sp. AB-rgal1]|uniref:hypothetical protein n=1 Tax=Evansella sp. AB-rgal1 TaxID=3242696 RepID=UPI00359EE059